MNRNEKVVEVDALKSRFEKAQIAILADYRGLTVAQVTDLRAKLKQGASSLKIVKNRLAKIAIQETNYAVLNDHFKGTVSLTTSAADPINPAKILTEFAKANEKFKLIAAAMDGKLLSVKQIEQLAKTPSRNELLSRLLGSFQAPVQNMANVLVQIPRQLVNVLSAIKEQKEKNL